MKRHKKKNKNRWSLFLLLLVVACGITAGTAGLSSDGAVESLQEAELFQEAESAQVAESVLEENHTSAAQTALSDRTDSVSELQVHYIDVGQGDATLLICDGEAMLIDAGDNSKGTAVQLYLQKQDITSLKYMIGTHPDADHIGGMDVIITKFDCDTVIMPDKESDAATYRDVIDAMAYKNYKNTLPVVGDTYALGDASFTIIAPNQSYSDTNNCSVGIILTHGKLRFLFTGDAETEAESDILDNGINIAADVLKVGHHGSNTSTGQAFLQAVNPKYAVISCGKDNSYGHPHEETLEKLKNAGAQVFRTDEQGSIIAVSDGESITWNTISSDSWAAGGTTDGKALEADDDYGDKSGSRTVSGASEAVPAPENGTETVTMQENGAEPTTAQGGASEIAAMQKNAAESVPAQGSGAMQGSAASSVPAQESIAEIVPEEAPIAAQEPAAGGITYVLNNNTKKFHYPYCSSAERIKESNREETNLTRKEIIGRGYVPCKNCNP